MSAEHAEFMQDASARIIYKRAEILRDLTYLLSTKVVKIIAPLYNVSMIFRREASEAHVRKGKAQAEDDAIADALAERRFERHGW